MSCTCELCQQLNLQSNVHNPNQSLIGREIANAIIGQNYCYQDFPNLVDDYQYQHERSVNDARLSTIRYASTLAPPVSPQSVSTPTSVASSSSSASSSISSSTSPDYNSILLAHTEMIEKSKSDLSRLKMDFNFCKEILTKQLEINAILLKRCLRQ